jgi:hypothetical protein
MFGHDVPPQADGSMRDASAAVPDGARIHVSGMLTQSVPSSARPSPFSEPTPARADCGGSVAPFTVPAQRASAIAFAVITSALGLIFAFASRSPEFCIRFMLFAAASAGWAYFQKAAHGVMIATAGMQTRALKSDDLQHIARVVAALNQAIAMR